jgi:enoyl-[acyl-carrier-protein] reductase (NADH)
LSAYRPGSLRELKPAQAVLLLMQNEAITGETIHVDCGARLV